MMIEPSFTKGPFTQPLYTKPIFFGPAYSEPTSIKVPPPQAPFAPNHAPWMDLSTQISSLSTHMEELSMINDTRFYSTEDQMDQYQSGFTSQFKYL